MTNIAQIATSTVEPVQAKPQAIRYDWMDEIDEVPEIQVREKDLPTVRLEGRFENWGSD